MMHKAGSWVKGLARRPLSYVVAPALAVVGILQLISLPLPNGDGILARIQTIINSKGSNVFAYDNPGNGSGNNIFSIAALQVQQNLSTAIPTLIMSAAAAVVGKWFKI